MNIYIINWYGDIFRFTQKSYTYTKLPSEYWRDVSPFHRLLVGAPKSRISDPNAIHSGGLYQCPLSDSTGDHKCHEVPVDLTYSAPTTGFSSNNSVQELGFSLASSDEEIVVSKISALSACYMDKNYDQLRQLRLHRYSSFLFKKNHRECCL